MRADSYYNERMQKASPYTYLEKLRERQKDKRVSREFQQVGLDIAEILVDKSHTALYIKLARDYDSRALFQLAKDVAERRDVKNKGAYFMKLFSEKKKSFMKNPKS